MSTLPTPSTWTSGHLFYEANALSVCDRVILDVVKPFVQKANARGLIDSFFFIRYWELGPHVRIRALVRPGSTEALMALLPECVEAGLGVELRGRPMGTLPPGSQGSPQDSLVWIPYIPETERYGGLCGVQVAEKLFWRSAELSLEVLEGIVGGTLDRNGIALGVMIAMLQVMTRDQSESAGIARYHQVIHSDGTQDGVARFDKSFELAFDRQSEVLTETIIRWWTAATEGALDGPLGRYSRAVEEARGELEALAAGNKILYVGGAPVGDLQTTLRMLLPSYMHMTNNRLGLSRIEEAFLGHALWRVLRDPR
ncbi:MAG TPA: thiopeptide-type bacteriocin biosynthesis protein [Gemmatimonadales bacterium]|nr:thiopeptide-type bacteriocin biosynthesis protein [Gemmatimonadales bacterium]